MFCKYCGAEIDDNSLFCLKCGKKLNSNIIITNENAKEKVLINNSQEKQIQKSNKDNCNYSSLCFRFYNNCHSDSQTV